MAESTRDALISAAMDLFFEHGFHAVGLDQIIARVGVTKTTFYNHFESKDDLVIAVLLERDRIEFADWLRIMNERGGDDPRGRILAMFDLLEDWLADPAFRGCLFLKAQTEYPLPADPVHEAAEVHGQNLMRALASQARQAGAPRPDLLAHQLMFVLAGAILMRTTSGIVDRARQARATAGVLVDHHLPVAQTR